METMKHIEAYQELFEHMSNEHGLTLLESEMQEIIRLSLLTVDNYNKATSEGQKGEESTEALHKHDVVGRSEQLNPDLDRGDFVEYIGGSNSKYLTKGEKYRLTGRMWGNRIAVIGSHNKRLNTLQRYFIGV